MVKIRVRSTTPGRGINDQLYDLKRGEIITSTVTRRGFFGDKTVVHQVDIELVEE